MRGADALGSALHPALGNPNGTDGAKLATNWFGLKTDLRNRTLRLEASALSGSEPSWAAPYQAITQMLA